MFRILLYSFLFYLVYKFIFELVIPVTKATSQVKDKLREMQEQQEKFHQQQQQATASQPVSPKRKDEDYIDFEEIK